MTYIKPKHQIETFDDLGLRGAYVHLKRNRKTGKIRWGVEPTSPIARELRPHQIKRRVRMVVSDWEDKHLEWVEWGGNWERIPLPLAEELFAYLCGAIQDAALRVEARRQGSRRRFRPSGTVIDLQDTSVDELARLVIGRDSA